MGDESNGEAVLAALERAEAVPELLRTLAESLVGLLGAEACLVSRAIGDILVDLVEHSPGGRIPGGHGYLISDYPATLRVLEEHEPASATVGDADADEREIELLRRIGFDAVLMLPLLVRDEAWGLVEVYGRSGFSAEDSTRALPLVTRAGELIEQLE